jgi:hypothetical protein
VLQVIVLQWWRSRFRQAVSPAIRASAGLVPAEVTIERDVVQKTRHAGCELAHYWDHPMNQNHTVHISERVKRVLCYSGQFGANRIIGVL